MRALRVRFECTDYRVAKHLETTTSNTTRWSSGETPMSPEFALKAAKLLDWHPAYAVASVQHEALMRLAKRKKEDEGSKVEMARMWRDIAKSFKVVLAGILLALLLVHGRANASVEIAVPYVAISDPAIVPFIHYAKLN
jgi:hypothetical protein